LSDKVATTHCKECKQHLVEIDNRGRLLRGCATCNVWWPLEGGVNVKLSVEDLQAIQQLRRTPQKRSPGRVRYQGSLAKLVRIRFVQGVGSDALNLNSEVQAKFLLSDRSFILLNGLTTVCPNYADSMPGLGTWQVMRLPTLRRLC